MKDQDLDRSCHRWHVRLPDRETDFDSARSCCLAKDSCCRNRCCATLALLLLFTVVGAVIGLFGARRHDAENLAKLREFHLSGLSHGGE